MTILFMLAFGGVIAGAIYGYRYFKGETQAAPFAAVEEAQEAVAEGAPGAPAKPHPLQSAIEVAGFRILEGSNRRLELQFIVINHSAVSIENLGGTIQLQTKDKKGNVSPFVSFPFRAGELGAYKTKELKTTLTTNLRAYELPDWQFLDAKLTVTAP